MSVEFVTALAAACLAATPVEGKATAPEAAVRAVVAGLTDAWNRHDMVAFAAAYAEDADFVNVIGMRWKGRAEIERQHVALHARRMKDTRLTEQRTTVRMIGADVALAQTIWELRGDAGAPGWKIGDVRRGVLTHVLVHRDGRWMIACSQNTDIVDVPNL